MLTKLKTRILCIFICLVLVLSETVIAASKPVQSFKITKPIIDVSTSSEGYFTVNYREYTNSKIKIGVTYKGETTYYTYAFNAKHSYAFNEGNGYYTITLYRNVYSTYYKKIVSKSVAVKMKNEFSPYLISTAEITFRSNDAIYQKAMELCEGITDDASKVVAIHNYIAKNFRYDYALAEAISNGDVKAYMPNTYNVFNKRKGICYDLSSLFAAMCRCQGIPCAMTKGYLDGLCHAWNEVYVNDSWIAIDMTISVAYRKFRAKEISDCAISLEDSYKYVY